MDYTAFAAQMKSGKALAPVVLIFGEEPYFQRRAVGLLQQADLSFQQNTFRFTSSDVTWPSLLSELCTPMFLGGKKLVVLQDEGNFVHNEAANVKAYVQSPSSAAILAMVCPTEKNPLGMEGRGLETVVCRSLKPGEVTEWLAAELQRRGKSIERPAAERLVECAGTDLAALERHVETLSLHAGSRNRILLSDVGFFVEEAHGYQVFELALAAAKKDRPHALRVLHSLLEAGENAQALVWRLAWQYRKMAEAASLLRSGVRRLEVPSRLQITYYPEKFMASVEAHTYEELLEKHQALLEADVALKTSGGGMEGILLDVLLCRLSSAGSLSG